MLDQQYAAAARRSLCGAHHTGGAGADHDDVEAQAFILLERTMSRSWDVFCRVVDNFGDAAVCWRLARQLAEEHAGRVRLWIDDWSALRALCPELRADCASQAVAGVNVHAWSAGTEFGCPAEIVVEAFGCGLPERYVDAMVLRTPRPVWIVLEYLSAEPWVGSHHLLPSPHPRLSLERHFFFPGVVPGTGGVLKEASLDKTREAFEASPVAASQFWEGLGFALPAEPVTKVSLFGYENPAAAALLQVWAEGGDRVVAAVPRGRLRPQVCEFLGVPDPGDGASLAKGRLEVRFLPFLPQPAYDELLWACDWNFVRGEDSFVRAQWAQRAMAWHIYPQAEAAHLAKLEAFLDAYCAGLDAGLAAALRGLWEGWNGAHAQAPELASVWACLAKGRMQMTGHARTWAARLAQAGDLAGNLAQYCEERLK